MRFRDDVSRETFFYEKAMVQFEFIGYNEEKLNYDLEKDKVLGQIRNRIRGEKFGQSNRNFQSEGRRGKDNDQYQSGRLSRAQK